MLNIKKLMFPAIGMIFGYVFMPMMAFSQIGFISNTVSVNYNGANSCQIIDFDGDTDMDLVTSASEADRVTWWENNGAQMFTQHNATGTLDGANNVKVVDIDGVNGYDLIAAGYNADSISWWANDGFNSFTTCTSIISFNGAYDVAAADMTKDTFVDVVGVGHLSGTIVLAVNDGTQNFTNYTLVTGFTYASHVEIADINEDTSMDIIATCRGNTSSDSQVIWLEGNGTTVFANHTLLTGTQTTLGANCVKATDLDKDNDIDILVVARSAQTLLWLENDGSENFIRHDIHTNWPDVFYAESADMDDDGDMDLVTASLTSRNIAWWENDGSMNFTPYKILDGSNDYNSYMVVAGDIDGDGKKDILSTHIVGDDVRWNQQIYFTPSATSTVTTTSTNTPTTTPTVTPTYTITQTITVSPTITPTSTVTKVSTVTPTSTISPTSTETPQTLQGLDLNWKNALAFPNPAKDQVTFVMHLPETAMEVSIHIYNLKGEQVSKIKESNLSGKGQTLLWHCADVAPGLYIAKVVIAGKVREVLKVAVVK